MSDPDRRPPLLFSAEVATNSQRSVPVHTPAPVVLEVQDTGTAQASDDER